MTDKLLVDNPVKGVRLLTMNHPEVLNALGDELLPALTEEVERFRTDATARCLVITGAGRGFSSGANVRGFAARIDAADAAAGDQKPSTPWEDLDAMYTAREAERGARGPQIVRSLHNLDKPSFAAVNGHAYGLGCGIAISCDFRVAAESARFNEAFIRNGLVPADGSAWQLPKLVGMSQALWMQYSGLPIDGNEAYRIGLANWVTPDDQLMDFTLEKASLLARGPVYAMGIVKQLIHQGYQQDLWEHLPLASRGQALTRLTDDHREGVQAFIQKRAPEFTGH